MVMNSNNHKKDMSPDRNHIKEEHNTMNKTGETENRKTGHVFIAAFAAIVLITVSGLIVRPMFAEAKGRFGQPQSADDIMKTLTERLDLTPEQVEAVRPVIEEKVMKHNEIWGRSDTERKTRRAEMRKLRWNTEIRLSEILTDEQVDKYLELKQEQRKGFKRGRHRGSWMKKGMYKNPAQVIERLSARLDLTEEQAAQAEPIIKESIEKRRAVFEKYREQGLKIRQAMRGEMKAISDATHAELSTILSDEQREKLNTIQKEKRARVDKWMDRHGSKMF
jgi:Spy/CpxP family protein refolding chaperone